MGNFDYIILNKAHIGIIGLRSVRTFLTKNQISLFIEKLTEELENDKNSNLYEFSINNNLINFKKSLKNHFQYMIDRTYNSIDFDDKYTNLDIKNTFAYCAFYKKLLAIVEDMEESDTQTFMKHYCQNLPKKYVC